MNSIFELATNISTPIALSGFIAAIFFYILRLIIKQNLFPKLTKKAGADLLKIIIDRLFILSLLAVLLGFAGYVIKISQSNQVTEKQSRPAFPAD